MKRGGALRGGRVAFETWGHPNARCDNVILILTGLSPSAHAAASADDPAPGWWDAMLGPGKAIDTDQWHVICVNALGSCKGSTGPASRDPATGDPYRMSFPDLCIEDIADAAAALVRALGFESLACVVGLSMGGMSALSLLARHPGLARGHINISSATHALPFAIAIHSLQREAIRRDPCWNGGDYDRERYPVHGMTLARKIGVTTYRSASEWKTRFGRAEVQADGLDRGRPTFEGEFEIERYLHANAERFARNYDPNSYLYLSRSMDWFDLGQSVGLTTSDALGRIAVEQALVVGTSTDILFPIEQQRQIADGLGRDGAAVQFHELPSAQGHDAFLVDIARFGPPVAAFLRVLRPCIGRDLGARPLREALRSTASAPGALPGVSALGSVQSHISASDARSVEAVGDRGYPNASLQ